MVIAILEAIAAVPKIWTLVQGTVQNIVIWYVSRQSSQTLADIADAAALAARAQTEEERYAAADAWRKAISRPRVSA